MHDFFYLFTKNVSCDPGRELLQVPGQLCEFLRRGNLPHLRGRTAGEQIWWKPSVFHFPQWLGILGTVVPEPQAENLTPGEAIAMCFVVLPACQSFSKLLTVIAPLFLSMGNLPSAQFNRDDNLIVSCHPSGRCGVTYGWNSDNNKAKDLGIGCVEMLLQL